MLEFFRSYQRYFFAVITAVLIFSFSFFGTYDAFQGSSTKEDRIVGKTMNGSSIMASELQQLSRFIATDCEDIFQTRGLPPNFCNDGVIRRDFLNSHLADLLVREYFDAFKSGFDERLVQVKRYQPYAHPEAPYLSAKTIWNHFLPSLTSEIEAIQAEKGASFTTFQHLSSLYLAQSQLPPEMLRRVLINQHKQLPSLRVDQKLSYEDLSLFGFHTLSDWFGKDFVDLAAQFILNVAEAAELKGYKVSSEEAKGDLLHHFKASMKKMEDLKLEVERNFSLHLRNMGLDESSASALWRKVLLFRRYFQGVGEAVFVDSLPYRDFANFAQQTAIVQKYECPIQLSSAKDLAELQFYLKSVCLKQNDVSSPFLNVEAVEKKCPELVQSKYRADVAQVTKYQLGLRPTVVQLWQWQVEDRNWSILKSKFSLANGSSEEERFKALEQISFELRAEVDLFSRQAIVDQNPHWIDEALAIAPLNQKTWTVPGNVDPKSCLSLDEHFFRVENLQKVEDKHVLTFIEAREALSKLVKPIEKDFSQEKNPLLRMAREALVAIAKNPSDDKWLQDGNDLLASQFKLRKIEQAVHRTSEECWMKEQAFVILPDHWSPVHVADDGQIIFFYMKERKITPAPILDQINFGKETLSADAKAYAAKSLLTKIKKKHAIVIPVVKEESNESI